MTDREMLLKNLEHLQCDVLVNEPNSIEFCGCGYDSAVFEFDEEGKVTKIYILKT